MELSTMSEDYRNFSEAARADTKAEDISPDDP